MPLLAQESSRITLLAPAVGFEPTTHRSLTPIALPTELHGLRRNLTLRDISFVLLRPRCAAACEALHYLLLLLAFRRCLHRCEYASPRCQCSLVFVREPGVQPDKPIFNLLRRHSCANRRVPPSAMRRSRATTYYS